MINDVCPIRVFICLLIFSPSPFCFLFFFFFLYFSLHFRSFLVFIIFFLIFLLIIIIFFFSFFPHREIDQNDEYPGIIAER